MNPLFRGGTSRFAISLFLPALMLISAIPLKGISWTIASLPGILIFWSIFGRLLTGLSSSSGTFPGRKRILTANLPWLRFFQSWGWIPVLLLFITPAITTLVFHATPPDIYDDHTYANAIMGTLPWNDAQGYYAGAQSLLHHGHLDSWSQRRPINSVLLAFRLWLSQEHLIPAILLQVVALAICSFFFCRHIAALYGFWCASACLGFLLGFSRLFFTTCLSEPLGLSLGLLSVTFTLRAMQTSCAFELFLGMTMLSCGMAARPGAVFCLFLLPAFAWRQFSGKMNKARLGVILVSGILLGAALNPLLSRVYGNSKNASFSNLSVVLCGLAHGETWEKAQERFVQETRLLAEADRAALFYQKAWKRFLADPQAFLNRLWEGERYFLPHLPPYLVTSIIWDPTAIPRSLIESRVVRLLLALLFLATFYHLARQRFWKFWATCWFAILLSAPFIIFDGGWRVFAVSWPILFMPLALVLAESPFLPQAARGPLPLPRWFFWFLALGFLTGLLFPLLRTDSLGVRPAKALSSEETIISGKPCLMGFHIASGASLTQTFPVLHPDLFRILLQPANSFPFSDFVSAIPDSPFLWGLAYDEQNHSTMHFIASLPLLIPDSPLIRIRFDAPFPRLPQVKRLLAASPEDADRSGPW